MKKFINDIDFLWLFIRSIQKIHLKKTKIILNKMIAIV